MCTFLAIPSPGLLPVSALAQTTNDGDILQRRNFANGDPAPSAAAGDYPIRPLGVEDISLTPLDLPRSPLISRSDGAGHTISGNNQFRGLVVGNLSAGPCAGQL